MIWVHINYNDFPPKLLHDLALQRSRLLPVFLSHVLHLSLSSSSLSRFDKMSSNFFSTKVYCESVKRYNVPRYMSYGDFNPIEANIFRYQTYLTNPLFIVVPTQPSLD
jgi:hypothetical protein